MTIEVGARIPSVTLATPSANGPKKISTDEIFRGKKVVLFAVPGAFTPTCSMKHLPGFVDHAAAIKAKGVDTIACMAVNDAFVLDAWAKDRHVDGKVLMLADGTAALTKALGMEVDLSAHGLGIRCRRFAMIVDDGRVAYLAIEPPGAFDVSRAEAILAHL